MASTSMASTSASAMTTTVNGRGLGGKRKPARFDFGDNESQSKERRRDDGGGGYEDGENGQVKKRIKGDEGSRRVNGERKGKSGEWIPDASRFGVSMLVLMRF
jgi:hypothetical protein